MSDPTLKQTPSQTIGPFFAYAMTPGPYGYAFADVATPKVAESGVPGQHIRLVGQVFDGAGVVCSDAMVEIWQADATGRYADAAASRGANASFKGFGRAGTGVDDKLSFVFDTIKPGRVEGQAPHITVVLFARGMLNHLFTRIYFPDEAAANAADPVLQSVPAERRRTLVATREDGPGELTYRFDIRLQGPDETVFFDV
jgi:protocatechuate 3,4-dioxygenase alpha subunit